MTPDDLILPLLDDGHQLRLAAFDHSAQVGLMISSGDHRKAVRVDRPAAAKIAAWLIEFECAAKQSDARWAAKQAEGAA